MEKADIKLLTNELKQIKDLKIEIVDIDKQLFDNQIPKGSKAYNLKCSVLFVDIRNSTDMTKLMAEKIWLRFIKCLRSWLLKL